MAEKKLTKKDLVSLFIRSNAVQSAFSFERQQAMGFEYAMVQSSTSSMIQKKKESMVTSVI